ncbi:MAG: T9SS type A sorting domain-containing protein [Bacteroidota bacterium]|nr:T9SS type A sorting domain-containing protein [Bacteroidota bacterium]
MYKIILCILLFYSYQARSQSQASPVIPATLNIGGGSAEISSGFVVDWSIGESTIIDTYYGQNAYANSVVGVDWYLTSGILQPFDTTNIIYNSLIPDWTNQEIRFYPVPTPDIINIDFRSVTTGKITIQLFSREGKLLGSKDFIQINSTSTQKWDLTNQASGTYYFRIFLSGANGEILKKGTFNIEKL